ncbi:UDP-2,4-diacetamido-2,4,6-trideoxy-beta-L-altropyranose hydrolase [Metabacillus fastidiosus]|uniref:UDP-2,4-diacetamido-2,4, 6-trideoxy-beta-L-altropyranose hydrolase n=1 Tax=Metabacillus fastidiosus TaxID=1458 RepID=UPI003D28B523
MNVVIRTDASFEIGTGHVMRCITLAKQLVREGAKVIFICRSFPGNGISFIQNQGFYVHTLSLGENQNHWQFIRDHWEKDAEETKLVISNLNGKTDLLIVDHYSLDMKWERRVRSAINHIMVIDDLADRPHDCDILLDQNYYLHMKNRYRGLVPDSCIQLLGPDYVLLRDEFLSIDIWRIKRDGNINNILIFFGGIDPTGETLKTLQAIQEIDRSEIVVHVVVGEANPNKERIEQVCGQMPNTEFYCQVSNMAELMMKADLSIGAGGTATWERCFLRLPSLTMIIAENQFEVTNAVAMQGAIVSLGQINGVNKELINKELTSLLQNPVRLQQMSRKCSELVNVCKVKKYPLVSLLMEFCS